MENLFKKEINKVYKHYVLFDRYVKNPNDKMENYIHKFEKHFNKIK